MKKKTWATLSVGADSAESESFWDGWMTGEWSEDGVAAGGCAGPCGVSVSIQLSQRGGR